MGADKNDRHAEEAVAGAGHVGEDGSDGSGAPTVTEAQLAVLHLVLAQLDVFRVLVLANAAGADALLKEASDRYWHAFTRGWKRERHARVFLLQCIDEVEVGRVVAPAYTAMAREKLDGSTRSTPLDPVFELFSSPPFRESFEASVQQKEFSTPDSIKAMYSAAYPIEARLLTNEQLERAVVEWRRMGGHRKHHRDPGKWDFLAKLFDGIGLGPVHPDTLAADWRDWRMNEKSHRVATARPSGAPGADEHQGTAGQPEPKR